MSRTDPHLADLERQIAETRDALGQTVEELAAKADVPARAKEKARQTAARLREAEARAVERASQAQNRGREKAELARAKAHQAGDRGRDTASHAAERVRHSADAAKSRLPGGSGAHAPAPAPESGAHLAVVAASTPSYLPAALGGIAVAAAAVLIWSRRHSGEYPSSSAVRWGTHGGGPGAAHKVPPGVRWPGRRP